VSTEPTPEQDESNRRFYRLRTPRIDGASTAVTVRVTPGADLYLAIGAGRRRMYLTTDEAWALWRCLSEAVASTGEPPLWIRTQITARPR